VAATAGVEVLAATAEVVSVAATAEVATAEVEIVEAATADDNLSCTNKDFKKSAPIQSGRF
jgi:hypothetical protein